MQNFWLTMTAITFFASGYLFGYDAAIVCPKPEKSYTISNNSSESITVFAGSAAKCDEVESKKGYSCVILPVEK